MITQETVPSEPTSPWPRRRPRRRDGSRSTPHSSPARDDTSQRKKANNIKKAVCSDTVDISWLRQLAISPDGLINNDIRKMAWPTLLEVDVNNIPTKPDEETLHGHRDYQQVVLDVNRSLKRFPPGMEEETRLAMQDQLVDVIMWVLVSHPELHYYQGYHDIVVTFLLVLGERLTFGVMDKLSKQHLSTVLYTTLLFILRTETMEQYTKMGYIPSWKKADFMDQTMDKTNHMLNYLYPLIGRSSPQLRNFMEKAETGTMFALSWLITWFGHVLNDIKHIVRLYDFFIACHPLMPIYLAAAIVLYREKEILACEPEMPIIHCLLSKIPDDLPFEHLIRRAGDLHIQFPPESLAKEAQEHYRQAAEEQKKFEVAKEARRAALRKHAYFGGKQSQQSRIMYRVTLWTITAVISAAAIAMLRSNTNNWWLWGH